MSKESYIKLRAEEIHNWINRYKISRTNHHISRDFSDAVPLAEILKLHFPSVVDLQQYRPKNSIAQKKVNWKILNRNVLSKLGINLSAKKVDDLARSQPGAIEKVLFQVRNSIKEKEKQKVKEGEDVSVTDTPFPAYETTVVPVQLQDGHRILLKKIIPSHIYDEIKKDIEEKAAEIITLEDKVAKLERVLRVRNAEIRNLTSQLRKLSTEYYTNNNLKSK
ncbi:spermatogenesis-associated 4-related [Holotrichia oblita]|uniref:Spermatogenesis-associated 4-related n=2 Tax=Holotrichia oblita TaxID=644536 RepID=A0ACB9STL6_HOLOL|nr:spermatogenesis-associated 4-related [Holotrichia oblita]KAI4457840.1 spermatogenesis-associated 4-related [Holotrichia oblita]